MLKINEYVNNYVLTQKTLFFRVMRMLSLAFAAFICTTSFAAVEQIGKMWSEKICFWSRPVIYPPNGWEYNEGISQNHKLNAFTQVGKDFADTQVLMYANAIPKSKEVSTLSSFIDSDLKSFAKKTNITDLKISERPPEKTKEGIEIQNFQISPGPSGKGRHEIVAYLLDGENFIIFVLSGHNDKSFRSGVSAFQEFLQGYKR